MGLGLPRFGAVGGFKDPSQVLGLQQYRDQGTFTYSVSRPFKGDSSD